MKKFELWLTPFGNLILFEWNACGCHPNEALKQWGKKNMGTLIGTNQKKNARALKSQGWECLDKW